jgi:hypothetical protein
MGGVKVQSPGRRYRRARRIRAARRGVVAVIGTLLALLVFFALFGIFLTQYVPLWMTDNEAQFTSQAATSFAQFKTYVDSQYLIGGPSVYGTPFVLSSNGVPLIAQPTQATLSFIATGCPGGFYAPTTKGETSANLGQPVNPTYCSFQNITLSSGPGGSGYFSQHVATGSLEMQLPNRYFNSQTFYFEDDGVIQSQGGTLEVMAVPPPFNVTTVAGNTSLTTSYLSMFGNATQTTGQGSQQVFTHLRYSQSFASAGKIVSGVVQPNSLNVTYEIGTENPCAWQNLFRSQMNVSGIPYRTSPSSGVSSYNWLAPNSLVNETIPLTSPVCGAANGQTTILSVDLHYVDYATVFYAGIQLTVGVGGT